MKITVRLALALTMACSWSGLAGAQTFKGKLTDQEQDKTFKVKLEKGNAYLIEMKSGDFDTYLYLRDAQGNELGENDDIGGGDLNSRLMHLAKESGEYQIIASSYMKEGQGDFEVTVRTLKPTGKPNVIKGKVDANSEKLQNIPFAPHKMELKAGTTYVIDLESQDFDAFLGIRKVGGQPIAADDDGGGGLNSRLTFVPTENGEYELMAGSLNGQQGDYTLTVRIFASAEGPGGEQKKDDGGR